MKNLDVLKTQEAIKQIKDYFQIALAKKLKLYRFSSPLIVASNKGLNDDLTGNESPLKFTSKVNGVKAEVVHSLAKWKRLKIYEHNISLYRGIYTDMNAIRTDEILDETHSIYVDQWDWELRIKPEDRSIKFLKQIVNKIYQVLVQTQKWVIQKYGTKQDVSLPEKIHFISSQELLDLYPNFDSKQRENMIAKKYGAVFIMQIGHKLSNKQPHDFRSPDYDDWNLNGDIIVYNPKSKQALELSSMGIRVDASTLKNQLKLANCESRQNLEFHQQLLTNQLFQTIGGGIGQSRLCYFLLQKAHIGEVQSSVWTDAIYQECKKKKINLL